MEVRLMRNSTLSLWPGYECSREFVSVGPRRCQLLDNQGIGMRLDQDFQQTSLSSRPFALRACIVGK